MSDDECGLPAESRVWRLLRTNFTATGTRSIVSFHMLPAGDAAGGGSTEESSLGETVESPLGVTHRVAASHA